jgi:hypothetical protein
VEGVASPLDFRNDLVGGCFSNKGLGVGVPVLGPGGDGVGEFSDVGEPAAPQPFVGEFFEPAFDQVQP